MTSKVRSYDFKGEILGSACLETNMDIENGL